MPVQVAFQRVATNGIHLNVAQAGPADGPLVILLHGFPEFWHGWRHQIGPLAAAGFRVWAPDQRGYNLSDKPRGVRSYRLDLLADDIAGLIAAAGCEQACVAGHDWGAEVAWFLALTQPERVRRLAIMNVPHPAIFRRYLLAHPAQLRRSWYIFFFQIPGLPEALARRDRFGQGVRALKGSSQRGTFAPDDLDRYRQAWSQPGALTGMVNWYRAVVRYPPKLPRDPRIHLPAMVLWGQRDRFLASELAELSVRLCDDGQLVTFPDATHWVQHEEAEAVNRHLIAFFQEGLSRP
jgi:pimeloyl-ACP methyl ester carboxylesterase